MKEPIGIRDYTIHGTELAPFHIYHQNYIHGGLLHTLSEPAAVRWQYTGSVPADWMQNVLQSVCQIGRAHV